MKNLMKPLLMMVLACSLSAIAQTSMSSDSSMKKNHMSRKSMSMTGCIAEKDGNYMMMNKMHPDGVQLMSSEDLKPHVGHKVKVKGMMEQMSGESMKQDGASSGDTMKHDGMDHMGMMSMKVTSMKMMSEQCDMSKMTK